VYIQNQIIEQSPCETLLNCVDVLFQEKESGFSVWDNIDNELKIKMKELIQTISHRDSLDIIKTYDDKAEIEINWFILKQLGVYFNKYGDPRISKIIQVVSDRNQKIVQDFF